MSEFLLKSSNNNKFAELLINSDDEDYMASSVHCAYYHFYQFVLYIEKQNLVPKQNTQTSSLDNSLSLMIRGSHQNTIFKYFVFLKEKKDTSNALMFWNKYCELSEYRRNADYKEVKISKDRAKAALRIAKELIQIIKELL